jgi:hypothetical protein
MKEPQMSLRDFCKSLSLAAALFSAQAFIFSAHAQSFSEIFDAVKKAQKSLEVNIPRGAEKKDESKLPEESSKVPNQEESPTSEKIQNHDDSVVTDAALIQSRPLLGSMLYLKLYARTENWCSEYVTLDIFPAPEIHSLAPGATVDDFLRRMEDTIKKQCPALRHANVLAFNSPAGPVGYLTYIERTKVRRERLFWKREPEYSQIVARNQGLFYSDADATTDLKKWDAIQPKIIASAKSGYRVPVAGAADRDVVDAIVYAVAGLSGTQRDYVKGSVVVERTEPSVGGPDRIVQARFKMRAENRYSHQSVSVKFSRDAAVCVVVSGSDEGCFQKYAALSGTAEDRSLPNEVKACLEKLTFKGTAFVENVIPPQRLECDPALYRNGLSPPQSCRGEYQQYTEFHLRNKCSHPIEFICAPESGNGRSLVKLAPGRTTISCGQLERNWKFK